MMLLGRLWMLVLMFLVAVPSVLAQGVLDSPWTVFTINTVIVWLILFIALTLLARSLGDNEKKMLQVAGFVAALIITWNFVGGSGYIWEVGVFSTIFNLQFLVNTVIITALLYFAATLFMGQDTPSGGAGKAGTWILAIVLAGMISAKMPGYIWEVETVRALIAFLFGDQGILTLNENRLFIFVGAAVLLAWLFNHIKVGGQEGAASKINWAIALIIAANMASGGDPSTVGQVVLLGQIVGTYIIWMNLRNSLGEDKGWFAFLAAFFLVDWVVSTIFPEYAFLGITGDFSFMGSLGWGVGVIALIIAFFVLRKRHRVFKEAGSKGWNMFRDWLGRRKGVAETLHHWNLGYAREDGELSNAFKELRLEIFTLMSYMQRHEVFQKKREKIVNEMMAQLKPLENSLKEKQPDMKSLHDEMRHYLDGVRPQKGQRREHGFTDQRVIIVTIVEKILKELIEKRLLQDNSNWDPSVGSSKEVEGILDNTISPLVENGKRALKHFHDARPRFMIPAMINAYRPILLDMYNPHGQYLRGYGFVRPQARPDLYQCTQVADNGITRSIDWHRVTRWKTDQSPMPTSGSDFIEVDIRGFAVDDVNAIQTEHNDNPTGAGSAVIRKYRREDIVPLFSPGHKYFSTVMEFIARDFEYLRLDLENLRYHPYARKEADYHQRYTSGYYDFSDVGFSGKKGATEVGFDREALKAPGHFTYWGRKRYDDSETGVLQDPVNPFPDVSLTGLWMFINGVTRKKDRADVADKYLRQFSMGYQELERMKQEQRSENEEKQNQENTDQKNA